MPLPHSRAALLAIATRARFARAPSRTSPHLPSPPPPPCSVCPSPTPPSTSSSSSSSVLIQSSYSWAPSFCTKADEEGEAADAQSVSGPSPLDSSSLIDVGEFHRLADELLNFIQEKVDDTAEELNIDGFDIDHAEGVVTIKLGALGTYVINKQTPNRQIWLSSPVSGPARFDWDTKHNHWVYRRTKARLLELLEKEMNQLLGASITFSTFKQQ